MPNVLLVGLEGLISSVVLVLALVACKFCFPEMKTMHWEKLPSLISGSVVVQICIGAHAVLSLIKNIASSKVVSYTSALSRNIWKSTRPGLTWGVGLLVGVELIDAPETVLLKLAGISLVIVGVATYAGLFSESL
eukprot:CAMPEP_0175174534 /NCGR_PEP_ID=MMETSP0087-20121206/32690_1 /TAXON_ID=136419 /ORGANISM="Unknown Unknown, Strain D1" /LENGTH=134 /DNA_ID=CAMNT_0016466023 /DNA_START=439 /DNA_END=839 /DNA_ORIENTATION=-